MFLFSVMGGLKPGWTIERASTYFDLLSPTLAFAMLASWLPALKASRLDPVAALRLRLRFGS
jgi:ABC-type antimicrobial peptide transport system permease subunit